MLRRAQVSSFRQEMEKISAQRLYKELAAGNLTKTIKKMPPGMNLTDYGRADIKDVIEAGKPIPGRKGNPLKWPKTHERPGALARRQNRSLMASGSREFDLSDHGGDLKRYAIREKANAIRERAAARVAPKSGVSKGLLAAGALAVPALAYGAHRLLRKPELPSQP